MTLESRQNDGVHKVVTHRSAYDYTTHTNITKMWVLCFDDIAGMPSIPSRAHNAIIIIIIKLLPGTTYSILFNLNVFMLSWVVLLLTCNVYVYVSSQYSLAASATKRMCIG